ncbi:MAG: oligosaccharide flippase family protein [Clostridia bacterium]|nr:oligosaccharide flippase family protein [Clostridia bacterium]
MNRKAVYIQSALLLALVNILLRGAGVSFNAYIARKIGAESMGLLSLTMSVYGFAVTLATSSVNLAAVRLTAERCAWIEGADRGSYRKTIRGVLKSICGYSLLFGCGAALLLWIFAGGISRNLLGDSRTFSSLRVLALSLPPIALTSAMAGYFTGMRKIGKNALLAILEQGMKILVTATALVLTSPTGSVEYMCLAVVGGSAVSEAWSLVTSMILYLTDSRMPKGTIPGSGKTTRETRFRDAAKIALPTAVGSYARQGLVTAEHLTIPWGMKQHGSDPESAMASYGVLQGMALPVVLFPYAVIGSFTGVLIPEITAFHAKKEYRDLRRIIGRVLRYTFLFTGLCFIIFFCFARQLGVGIYHNEESVKYIRILAFLVPFMYVDTVTDAILKGMGEQVYCMKINLVDAACSLVLVAVLTPVMGLYGYILSMFFCEIVNLGCSAWKLWDCVAKTKGKELR